ncbi:hypothetical protein [Aureibacter tunicatorum]|uniref:Uncharacterized protein n=1 Tax=Aureibacter tunicatorum TaxID=866807 RepID=A0AAE4BR52_9BACT|nr:hypothetical protein [Aureibacter tunicatorum]MDR6239859.1 hypothetical protein [Aureibacter tunicatorum]BDD04334.1 hypothetical protein AUTU_18170 [Aureibacter tunicatorum]
MVVTIFLAFAFMPFFGEREIEFNPDSIHIEIIRHCELEEYELKERYFEEEHKTEDHKGRTVHIEELGEYN